MFIHFHILLPEVPKHLQKSIVAFLEICFECDRNTKLFVITHFRNRRHRKMTSWKQMKTIGRCCPKMLVRRLDVGATKATVASASFLSVWFYGALAPGLCME